MLSRSTERDAQTWFGLRRLQVSFVPMSGPHLQVVQALLQQDRVEVARTCDRRAQESTIRVTTGCSNYKTTIPPPFTQSLRSLHVYDRAHSPPRIKHKHKSAVQLDVEYGTIREMVRGGLTAGHPSLLGACPEECGSPRAGSVVRTVRYAEYSTSPAFSTRRYVHYLVINRETLHSVSYHVTVTVVTVLQNSGRTDCAVVKDSRACTSVSTKSLLTVYDIQYSSVNISSRKSALKCSASIFQVHCPSVGLG